MTWYYYIVFAALFLQGLFLVQVISNYRYALKQNKKRRPDKGAQTALIVPCKGLEAAFKKNITAFYQQNYQDYHLYFVVADESDPAYEKLLELKENLASGSNAKQVNILVAGHGSSCSQKIHNLLYCCRMLPDDIEVIAFADSDACPSADWLSHLVYPLSKSKIGATSGYRWFIPHKKNPAALALSALNAKVTQMLGNSRFNQAWGGSMAIKVKTFRDLGLDKIWPHSVSDDFSLTCAVKKAGLKLAFVPRCLVASYENISWKQLFRFARRQFIITRVTAFRTWLFALFSAWYSVLGIWGTLGVAVYAAFARMDNFWLFFSIPLLFLAAQITRAVLRQKMVATLLPDKSREIKAGAKVDILFGSFWSILLLGIVLSSAFGRTINWRGIRYRLEGPASTSVLGPVK